MDYQIYFPHLGIYFEHVIKSFSIGGFSIAVYGVTMAMALLCGLLVTNLRAKETKQNSDHYFDLFICFILFGFLGARLYYVACTWSYYREHLNQIKKKFLALLAWCLTIGRVANIHPCRLWTYRHMTQKGVAGSIYSMVCAVM